MRNYVYPLVSIFVRRASHAIASAKVMLRRVFHNQKKYPWEVKYTTIKKLDRGGNAQVVLVVDNEKNEFALKPLCPEYVKKSSDKRKRFLREVDVMRNELRDLSGVIPIIDFSEEGLLVCHANSGEIDGCHEKEENGFKPKNCCIPDYCRYS